jgi:hypothetical protein
MGIILYPGSYYIQVNSLCRVEKTRFELRIKDIVLCDMEYFCVRCLAMWLGENLQFFREIYFILLKMEALHSSRGWFITARVCMALHPRRHYSS